MKKKEMLYILNKIRNADLPCGKNNCNNCHDEMTQNGKTCMRGIAYNAYKKLKMEVNNGH